MEDVQEISNCNGKSVVTFTLSLPSQVHPADLVSLLRQARSEKRKLGHDAAAIVAGFRKKLFRVQRSAADRQRSSKGSPRIVLRVRAADVQCELQSLPNATCLMIGNQRIVVTWDETPFGGLRAWWRCPRCSARVKHLYFDALVCRRCSGVEYACDHQQTTVPGERRVTKLRRRRGNSPYPFSGSRSGSVTIAAITGPSAVSWPRKPPCMLTCAV